jgi:PPOX class probable F420-dependent enzyme
MIDFNSKLGRKAKKLIDSETIVWLTTVGGDLTPQPRPVWFVPDGEDVLIYSKPEDNKVRHIRQHGRVSLHFNTDQWGGDPVLVLTGDANMDAEKRRVHQVAAYVKKYKKDMAELEMTPEQFAESYSQAIRVKLTGMRGW